MWSALLFLSWVAAAKSLCPPDLLAMYKVVLHTEWSEERFPKQYPKWRPPAQWSLVVGRSHNSTYRLWQLGDPATDAVKQFVETGKTELLFRETAEEKKGILSEFFAPAITEGVGRTETKFFVDGNHSKVSLMCRVVPSPDWFVGINSFDLCTGKQWVDAVTLDLDPIDAGTDNGFTFTSPNWDTEPRESMTQITARFPRHPANSFFYPDLKKLPRIAYLRLIKMKEYSLTQEFFRDPKDELNAESVLTTLTVKEEQMDELKMSPISMETRRSSEGVTTKSGGKGRRKVESSLLNSLGPNSEKDPSLRKRRRKAHGGDKPKIRSRGPRPCRVTDWSEWGLCSQTCGFGEQTRSRKVFKHAVRGGRPCPPLEETRWCGSARTCKNDTSSYFKW